MCRPVILALRRLKQEVMSLRSEKPMLIASVQHIPYSVIPGWLLGTPVLSALAFDSLSKMEPTEAPGLA